MNYSLTTVVFTVFCSFLSLSQKVTHSNETAPTKKSLYNISYRLADESNLDTDSTILENIHLLYCEQFRLEDEEVTITDPTTQLEIVLFPKNSFEARPKYWMVHPRKEH